MYPGKHASLHPDRPAVVMAGSGETITYGELEARSNRLAHLLRTRGLGRLDHYSIYMENHPRYVECCAAGERSGHYYTCVNSFLTVEELAYILNNSQSKVLSCRGCRPASSTSACCVTATGATRPAGSSRAHSVLTT